MRGAVVAKGGALLGSALIVGVTLLGLLPSPATSDPLPKVTFCHRTDSEHNPYDEISSDGDSIIQAGHTEHTGPVFPDTDASGNWGDIIPPFDYTGGHFGGLNWTSEGQSVLSAGCAVEVTPPEPPPTTTTTTTSTSTTTSTTEATTVPPHVTTTTSTPTTTSTTQPTTVPAHVTTTTAPGTTSTAAPGVTTTESPNITAPGATTTSTTAPGSTTEPTVSPEAANVPPVPHPPEPIEITGPAEAEVVTPGDHTVELGALNGTQREELENEQDAALGEPLAFTGLPVLLFVAGGVGLIVIGALLTRRHLLR